MYEIKTEDVYEDFSSDKCLISVIIQLRQNTMRIQTNWSLANSKMKLLALQLKNVFD